VDTGYDRAATFDHPFLVLIDLDATSRSSYPLQFLVITSVWNLESRMTVLPFMCLGDVQLTCSTHLLRSYPILGGYSLGSFT
jgi:hypothetical protein